MTEVDVRLERVTKSFADGNRSFTWNGTWSSDNKPHTGTYTYQLKATDHVGYTYTTGTLSTTIRNYELVQTSGSAVKVIPR